MIWGRFRVIPFNLVPFRDGPFHARLIRGGSGWQKHRSAAFHADTLVPIVGNGDALLRRNAQGQEIEAA
jgi:hypothetical protein